MARRQVGQRGGVERRELEIARPSDDDSLAICGVGHCCQRDRDYEGCQQAFSRTNRLSKGIQVSLVQKVR